VTQPAPAACRIDMAPGYSISRLLKGGWHLSSGHGAGYDRDQAIRDMAAFVEAGITSFDCADHYLGVEQLIGDFRRAHPGLAKRVQVHTKYVPDLESLATLTRADTERIIDRSLARLGVEALDLVQYYWWNWAVPGAVETAMTLADLRKAGKIRHLGLTNFSTDQMQAIVGAGVPIAANQIQYSLVDRRPEARQIEFCRRHGIAILTYGHLLGGFMAETWQGAPEPAEPYANRSLRKYKLIVDDFGGWALFQELLAALGAIGRRLGVGPGEVALRWTLDRPGIAGCIVGATSTRHLARNLKVFDIALTEADRQALDAVCAKRRGPAGDVYALESERGGRHNVIMRPNQNKLEDRPWPGT
jgi:aryl-alcohol dehydrogenase-like predicted oxidoreductase